MTWRVGTKNRHALYCDVGGESVPHGFIMQPEVAKRICDAMNGDSAARHGEAETLLSEVQGLLKQTRWEPRGTMREWENETIDGRSFSLVSKALKLLGEHLGEGDG